MLMEKDSLIRKPTSYQIGIMFCLWRYNKKSNKIIFTSDNIYFLEQIKNLFVSNIETYISLRKITRFKISTYPNKELLKVFNIDINNIPSRLNNLPENIDLREFFRAYLEINSKFQMYENKTDNKRIRRRLRITGREVCLNTLNSYAEDQGLASKKSITNVSSQKINCHSLSYTIKEELINLYNFFHVEPYCEEYWKSLKENIETYHK